MRLAWDIAEGPPHPSTSASPRSVPLISYHEATRRFVVGEEAATKLRQETRPISFLVAAGGYRSGKSSLLNLCTRMAGYPAGFGVGHTVQACTKGLHMYAEPIVVQRTSPTGVVPLLNGSGTQASVAAPAATAPGHVFYIVDTEGLSDPAIDNPTHGSHILLFATLVASTLLFNVQGKIDSTTLQDLACVVAMRNMVRSGSEGDASPWGNIPPPTLLVAIRDFELELKNAQGRNITSDEYLNAVLRKDEEEDGEGVGKRVRREEGDDESAVRSAVRDFFPRTACLTLRRPTMQTHAVGQETTAFRALSPVFRNDLALLWMHLHRTIEVKRTQEGSLMTGAMLVRLLETAVECVNEGRVFTMQDAYTSAAEEQCRAARDRVRQLIHTVAKREQERCRQGGAAPEPEWIDQGVQKALSVYHTQAFGPPMERHARELETEVRTLLTEMRDLIVEEKRNSTVLWTATARTSLAEWSGHAPSASEEAVTAHLDRAVSVWSDARTAFPLADAPGVEAVWTWGGAWQEAVLGWVRGALQQLRQGGVAASELAAAKLELEHALEERASAARSSEKWRAASDAKAQDLEAARKELHDAQRIRHQMSEVKSELCDVQAELARSRASVEVLQRTRQEEAEQSAAKVESLLRSLEEARRAVGEAKRSEEVAVRVAEEAKRSEAEAIRAVAEAKRAEEGAVRAAAEAKRGEEAASRVAAEAKRGEEGAVRSAAETSRAAAASIAEANRAVTESKRNEEGAKRALSEVQVAKAALEARLKSESEIVARLRQQVSDSEASATRRAAAEELRMRRMTEACQELRKEAEVQSEENMRLATDLKHVREELQVARDDLQAVQERMQQQQNKYHERLATAQSHELELGTLRQSVARLQRENARYMAALTGERAGATDRTDP